MDEDQVGVSIGRGRLIRRKRDGIETIHSAEVDKKIMPNLGAAAQTQENRKREKPTGA